MNHELIKKAIFAHFACDDQMRCYVKFEDSVEAAKSFYYHLIGENHPIFKSLIKTHRYKNKLTLIQRYLNQNEK